MIFNPILSILIFSGRFLSFRVYRNKSYRYSSFDFEGDSFKVFRHIGIKEPGRSADLYKDSETPAVLVLQFRFPHSSLNRDRWDSFFQIPVFAGLPGFCAKLWTFSEEKGTFQGVYQWKSKAYAEAYLASFAVNFVRKKAVRNSVSYKIFPGKNLDEFINGLMY